MLLPHHAMQTKCWANMFHWSQTHISSNTLLPSIYDTMLSMSEYSQHSEYSILLQPVWHSSSCLLPAVGRKDWWQWFLTSYGPTNSKKISAHPRLSLYDSIGRIGVPSYYGTSVQNPLSLNSDRPLSTKKKGGGHQTSVIYKEDWSR